MATQAEQTSELKRMKKVSNDMFHLLKHNIHGFCIVLVLEVYEMIATICQTWLTNNELNRKKQGGNDMFHLLKHNIDGL